MLATEYARHYGIDPQGETETDSAFRHRVAGRLRDMGKVILAHEAQRNERIEDSRDVLTGVQGAIVQAIQGIDYNASGEMQSGLSYNGLTTGKSPQKRRAMKTIKIEVTNNDAWAIASYLRDRYKRDRRTTLNKLCEIAIRREVAEQARIELAAAEKALAEELT